MWGEWRGSMWESGEGREVLSVDHWECCKFGWYYKAAEGQ